jgi:hypothetical protein
VRGRLPLRAAIPGRRQSPREDVQAGSEEACADQAASCEMTRRGGRYVVRPSCVEEEPTSISTEQSIHRATLSPTR